MTKHPDPRRPPQHRFNIGADVPGTTRDKKYRVRNPGLQETEGFKGGIHSLLSIEPSRTQNDWDIMRQAERGPYLAASIHRERAEPRWITPAVNDMNTFFRDS